MVDFPAPPATALVRFPTRTLAAGSVVHRIHHRELGPCWFSSFPPDDDRAGRFDLAPPRGSSYWALRPAGAFLETIARSPVRVVPLEIIDRYAMTSVRLPRALTLANSPVQRARAFGLTAEFHTTADYSSTRPWAAALDAAGHAGLLSVPRHDVTARLRSLTLFGRAGEHVPKGWKPALTTGPVPTAVVDSMRAWGIHTLPIPFDVDTVAPT